MSQPIWNTPSGSLGSFPSNTFVSLTFSAQAVSPATSITFKLLSGSLPNGLSLNTNGVLSGSPNLVVTDTISNFTIRVTDNLGNIRDRSFSIRITSLLAPSFITPIGNLFSIEDSTWVEYQIQYNNPYPENPFTIEVTQGILPPGLEINTEGLIRGYARPPVDNLTLAAIETNAIQTISSNNSIVCLSTFQFTEGRPVIFSGATLGGIVAGQTYYIKSIINATTFTISVTQFGSTFILNDDVGSMVANLLPTSIGQPTIRTFSFALTLFSTLGNVTQSYSITVINQNTPVVQGGPGKLPNTRIPSILNTRPLTFNLTNNDPFFGYYVVETPTIPPTSFAQLGTYTSGNYFAYKIIGYDFDGSPLSYVFSGLPDGIVGDSETGWIQGVPTLSTSGISTFNFSVSVFKTGNPTIQSIVFNYQASISKDINGTIIWISPNNLGTVNNGSTSLLSVAAESDVDLKYRIVGGNLPPNLVLLDNGNLAGKIAYQPTSSFLDPGATTQFDFTVEAYSPVYPSVTSNKSFSVSVVQIFEQPTDTLYMKATPDVDDRVILDTLLYNSELIPDEFLFRPNDINFGKATSVVYAHAYGIYANAINDYIAAVSKNHYWRRITLGEIKTALAKNNNGEVIYEVVYSEVIDNLVNPQGESIPESIFWPRRINLNLGPWITSETNIFTSYENVLNQNYYTSLSPGVARTLYPNSLVNMRTRVGQELGQIFDSRLLPLWMTSQQENGSTLGFTPAWVICYTKPGFSKIIKNNIDNIWPYTLNQINFKIDRFSVDKSITYNYDTALNPATWTGLPSATPIPNPIDSKDFYVLFPRKTILPDTSE